MEQCLKFSSEKGLGEFVEYEFIPQNMVTSKNLTSFSPRLDDFRLVLAGS